MGLTPKFSTPSTLVVKTLKRKSKGVTKSIVHGGASVSEKLEVLKSLIPSNNNVDTKPDQLFQETADYIVKLKTQVFVLQKLIDYYGSNQSQEKTTSV